MVKISKNRKLKALTGFIMTFVMILSLFGGIGAIWVNEDTNKASAEVVNSEGIFDIPGTKAAGSTKDATLGTDDNPFVVLEIVPNESMAMFGYLVGGQEPVNLNAINEADIATKLTHPAVTPSLLADSLSTWVKTAHEEDPIFSDFSDQIDPLSFEKERGGKTFKYGDLIWESIGYAYQYGHYVIDPENKGDYDLQLIESSIETEGDDYVYAREFTPATTGKKFSELTAATDEELEGKTENVDYITAPNGVKYLIDMSILEGKTKDEDYFITADGDIYLKVEEGTGTYSSKIFKYVGTEKGIYSLEHKIKESSESGDFNYEIRDEKYYDVVFKKGVEPDAETFKTIANVLEGSKVERPAKNPKKTGSVFSFWANSETPGVEFNFDTETVTSDLTLVAIYNVETFDVTFDSKGGSDVPKATIAYDNLVPKPEDPTREGYYFRGWYADEDYETEFDFEHTKITEARTIYAKWEIKKFNVTFSLGDATGHSTSPVPTTQVVEYNKRAVKPSTDPVWPEHKFAGWKKLNEDNSLTDYNFTTLVTSDLNLVAGWDEACTVTFELNGSSDTVPTQTVIKGNKATKPSDPRLDGCLFGGWFEVLDGGTLSSTAFNFDTAINHNTVLRAKWNCTISFNSNGGNPVSAITLERNKATVVTQPVPTWDSSHEFIEWQLNDAHFDFTSAITLTESITLVAKWKNKGFTVKFDLNGGDGNIPDQVVAVGGKATDPGNQTNATHGGVLKGWQELTPSGLSSTMYNFNTTVDHDMTLVALWEYTVTFNANGGYWFDDRYNSFNTFTVNVLHGQKVSKPDDPYKWSGQTSLTEWRIEGQNTTYIFDTPVTESFTLNAVWGNKYIVVFDANGGKNSDGKEITTLSISPYEYIDVPTDPTWDEDHEFVEWQEDGEAVDWYERYTWFNRPGLFVTTSHYIKAVWKSNIQYTVTLDANGGSISPTSVKVKDGEHMAKPADPTREGYYFDGWKLDGAAFTFGTDDQSTQTITRDITLVASWVQKHTVTFNTDGGSQVPSVEVRHGEKIDKPETVPVKAGFAFKGWKLVNGSLAFGSDNKSVNAITDDTVMIAIWEEAHEHKVTFYNRGTKVGEIIVPTGNTIASTGEALPTIDETAWNGYGFKYWALKGSYDEYDIDNEAVVGDIELKAVWQAFYYETNNGIYFYNGIGAADRANSTGGRNYDFETTDEFVSFKLKTDGYSGPTYNVKVLYDNKTQAQNIYLPNSQNRPDANRLDSRYNKYYILTTNGATNGSHDVEISETVTETLKISDFMEWDYKSNANPTSHTSIDSSLKITPRNPASDDLNKDITYNGKTYKSIRENDNNNSAYNNAAYTPKDNNRRFDDYYIYQKNQGKYHYVYTGNVTNYYNFEFDDSANTTNDTNHYHVIFEYAGTSGRYVVNSADESKATSANAGMTYFRHYYDSLVYGDSTDTSSINTINYASNEIIENEADGKDTDNIMSFASRAVIGNGTTAENKEIIHASKTEKKGVWVDVPDGTGDYAKVTGDVPKKVGTFEYYEIEGDPTSEKHTIKLGEYKLEKEISVSSTKLPELVSGDGLVGSRDYVRLVIRKEIITVPAYSYKMVELSEENKGTGKYRWEGESYNKEYTDAEIDNYENYFDNNLLLLSEEEKDEMETKRENGEAPFDSLPSKRYKKLNQAYVQTLENKELFKQYVVGLGYKDGDIKNGNDTTGYQFVGWYKDPYGVNPFILGEEGFTSDITVYAKWLAKYADANYVYSVSFSAPGADASTIPDKIENINSGSKICRPEKVPVMDNKLFVDWYTDADHVNEEAYRFDFNSAIESDITLYAGWKDLDSKKFEFTFEGNISSMGDVYIKTGTLPAAISDVAMNGRKVDAEDGNKFKPVPLSTPICLTADNKKSDYIFAGWYLNKECTEKFDFDNATATLEKFDKEKLYNIILYAKWVNTKNLPEYKVTFNMNEPASGSAKALSKAGGISKYTDSATVNYATVTHGGKIKYGKNKKKTVENLNEIIPVLEGNVEAKIENYIVKVITVTPEDLKKSQNLGLIDRANLIVISQANDNTLKTLFGTYRNESQFPSTKPGGYSSTMTDFVGKRNGGTWVSNDLSWTAVERIVSKVAGITSSGASITPCPIIYDYNVYNSVTSCTDDAVYKSFNLVCKFSAGDDQGRGNMPAYNSNVYKLYLMTQKASPITLYNAYIRTNSSGTRGKSGSGSIENTGSFTSGVNSGGTLKNASINQTNNDMKNYWAEDTLVPWNLIDKTEFLNGNYNGVLGVIGFVHDSALPVPETGKETESENSRIKNRVLVYDHYTKAADNSVSIRGFARDISSVIMSNNAEMSSVLDIPVNQNLEAREALYYLLHSDEKYENYNHDLRILDIEPGSNGKDASYWFWYISRYMPDYTGDTTVRTMSTVEFNCNIDDLNSMYDIIYIGTDTRIVGLNGTVEKDSSNNSREVTVNLPSTSSTVSGNTSYWIKKFGDSNDTKIDNYSLVHVVSGMKINRACYRVNSVEPNGHSTFKITDVSADPVDGYLRAEVKNIFYPDNNGHLLRRVEKLDNVFSGCNWDQQVYYNSLDQQKLFYLTPNRSYGTRTVWNGSNFVNSKGFFLDPIVLQIKPSGYSNFVNINTTYEEISGAYDSDNKIYVCEKATYEGYGWRQDYYTNFKEIAFNVVFYYKATTTGTADLYNVAPLSANTTIDFTGDVLVPNGATITSPMIYSHVGREATSIMTAVGSFNSRNNDGTISANDDITQTTVTSGNDISFKKYKDIAEFLKAGYPIILSKTMFETNDTNTINHYTIDSASWIYKLASQLTSKASGSMYDDGYRYYWYRENNTEQDANFKKALTNKTFRLIVDENKRPVEYKDPVQFSTYKENMIYINGAPYNKNDGADYTAHQYDNIDDKKLEYEITVDSEVASSEYRLRMYIDANADGRYDEESEQLDSIQIEDLTTGAKGNSGSIKLRSGHKYKVTRTIADYTGIIPWKLVVAVIDKTTGKETAVRDEVTGMSAIKVKEKDKLYVLQITSDVSSYGNKGNWVYFPTDEEIATAATNRGHLITSPTEKYFTKNDVKFGKEDDVQLDNASAFHYYASKLNEFEVHFFRVSVSSAFTGTQATTTTLADIAADTTKTIGYTYKLNDAGSYVQDKEIKWADINMLILGYADCYNDISDKKSLELIEDFIAGGKTTLFTHDTTSYMTYGEVGKEAGGGTSTFSTAWNAINTSKQYWGYNISKYFRDLLGMDRYGVQKNRGLLDGGSNPSITGFGEMFWNVLKNEGEYNNAGGKSNVKDFSDISIGNAKQYTLQYDIPFKTGTTMDLYSTAGVAQNTNITNVSKSKREGSDTGNRVLGQGFITKIADGSGNNEIKPGDGEVTRNNTGQIVTYPYTIGTESNKYSIQVANTHTQYYQLNMEDDEIVVWYSIHQANNKYQNLINDGSNNYYIYNKGNITYSGVGHSGNLTNDEYKLFINTMIAAYTASVKPTEPEVTNSDKSVDKTKDYIYVDFDATIPLDSKVIDPDSHTEVKESTIPIGNDVRKVYDTEHNIWYYTKRIRFTLKNYSIIMNKVMTVYYYPVVYEKDEHGNLTGNRVVMYNKPIPLKTYNVKEEDKENPQEIPVDTSAKWDAAKIRSIGTLTAGITDADAAKFAYRMPDGKLKTKTGDENYDIIGVGGTQRLVESLEEYYVDIPISDNYYDKVLGLGDTYEFMVDSDSSHNRVLTSGSDIDDDYNKNHFGIDEQSRFEIEMQIVMRYGRDQSRNLPLVGTRGVVFMRRGMFTLD